MNTMFINKQIIYDWHNSGLLREAVFSLALFRDLF